jgi:hypothetical protein
MIDYSGTRYADVDDGLRLTDAVECACHKRIVFDRVGEADEFGAG